MKKLHKKTMILNGIFFIFLFLSFAVRFDLFTIKVWGQCLVASSIVILTHLLFRYYASQKR